VLWEYELADAGLTNIAFDAMEEDVIYCIHATAPYSLEEAYFFVMVRETFDPLDTELFVQLLEGTCEDEGIWGFDVEVALRFVR
jgi:hypothetical protein